jgi:hypothetical protein
VTGGWKNVLDDEEDDDDDEVRDIYMPLSRVARGRLFNNA